MSELPDRGSATPGRRGFLKLLGVGAAAAYCGALGGCSYYPAESGPAFEPWKFPEPNEPAHMVAARAALLAASPHNTQPWLLRVSPDRIELHADPRRNLGTMDSLRREFHIGLGCAIENVMIAARANGAVPEIVMLPDPAVPDLIARITLRGAARSDAVLFQQIPKRHTNRGAYLDRALSRSVDTKLAALVNEQPGLQLRLLTTARERRSFREQTIAATQAIIADAEMSADSERWYRHTREEIARQRDGVTLDATGSGALTRFLAKSLPRPDPATANAYWLDATREHHMTGGGFGLITSTSRNTRQEQLLVGRAFQRLQLWAASEGLAAQPLNQLAERQDRELTLSLPAVSSRGLEDLIGARDRRAQMLFRIGHPVNEALASPRRPLPWVLV